MNQNYYKYFCTECKKEIENYENSIVVEQDNIQPFCSNECIRVFFRPEITHFQGLEQILREQENFIESIHLDENSLENYVQETLSGWQEHFVHSDKLGRSYHYLIRKFRLDDTEFYLILVTKFLKDKPSFLLHHIITKQNQFIDHFRIGKKLEVKNSESIERKRIPDEVITLIEQTKSEFFADLINDVREADIQIEDYYHYEKCRLNTLENADEVFSRIDDEGRIFETHVKAFNDQKQSFLYFVICLMIKDEKQDYRIPVFSFPSKSHEIYVKYSEGKVLKEKDLN